MIDPAAPDYSNTPASTLRPRFTYASDRPVDAPVVTVVTPFKDTGPVFHETATTVLRQSFQQFEWLIVNDGSTTPEALAILDEYRRRDPRIRVLDLPENRGVSAARNAGFRAARARYVVQIDSDNLLEPTAVEKWLWFLETRPEYAFVKGYSVGFGAEEYLWSNGFHSGRAFLSANQLDITAMLRRDVHAAVGGYDEGIRDGLEDWEFWLRCASSGYWGGTIPEYLDWYRRRPAHSDRWSTWDGAAREKVFAKELRRRYPDLWRGKFPTVAPRWQLPHERVPDELPFANPLRKEHPRLLLLVPWLTMGGADKFNLDLVRQLSSQGWEITIATTADGRNNWWLPEFARLTPDIFILASFLQLIEFPRFIRYLARSRQVDRVLLTHSELAYLLLPYLRAYLPSTPLLDFCHIEEREWKNGGYPRMSALRQELLDLSVASSSALGERMVQLGAEPERIRVCYTGVDTQRWRPDPAIRAAVRAELRLDESVPVILYAARVCAQKQPAVLARTIEQLAARGLDFVVLIAGDGPDLERLRATLATRRLLRYARILGAVSNERVRDLMLAADIFFLPSEWEGISLAIYEAMACGLPVVSADVGGQRELVSADCGILIPRSDEDCEARRYAEVLAGLLSEPERRQAMGQAARARVVAGFDVEQMGRRMVELLEEAAGYHAAEPCRAVSVGLAPQAADLAVEYFRLGGLADSLWSRQFGAEEPPVPAGTPAWRRRLYLRLYRWHQPLHHRYRERRGWGWLTWMRLRLKQALLRAAS